MSEILVAMRAAIAFAALFHAQFVRAEVRVTRDSGIVRIEAHNASVQEILSALHDRFGLQYRSATPLQFRISATYQGPLQEVLMRVLAGYDFFVRPHAGTVTVVIIGSSRTAGEFQAAPPVEEHPFCKVGIAGSRVGICK
jgi:hypothetical protein